jgi:hypothetical protein
MNLYSKDGYFNNILTQAGCFVNIEPIQPHPPVNNGCRIVTSEQVKKRHNKWTVAIEATVHGIGGGESLTAW